MLRKSYEIDGAIESAEALSRALLELHPSDLVAVTVRAAVLKDCFCLTEASNLLLRHLNEHSDSYFLRVVASVLWHQNWRTSAVFVFNLADELERPSSYTRRLTPETVETIRARLTGQWLPANDYYRTSELGKQPVLASEEITRLEQTTPVDGLEGYSIRPLKSKRQLARVANHLKNCLNSYLNQVQQGTTLLFAIEKNGVPVEAIEVNPSTRRIVQWKAARNSPPNELTRPHIEQALSAIRPAQLEREPRRTACARTQVGAQ